MFTGSVSFEARFKRHGLIFPKTEYVPPEASVDKVEIEGPDGKKIRCTVYLSSVATHNEGRAIASKVCEEALDRIAFMHDVVIEVANKTDDHFSRIDRQPGMVDVSGQEFTVGIGDISITRGVDASTLTKQLEQPTPPGKHYYGSLRAARQSTSPVEEFMSLYHCLLMVFSDKQNLVDDFIEKYDPTLQHPPKPPRPKKKKRGASAMRRRPILVSVTTSPISGLVSIFRKRKRIWPISLSD